MFFADVDRLVNELKGHERITLALAPAIIWDMGEEGYRNYGNMPIIQLRITMHLDETCDDDEYPRNNMG